MSGLDVSELRAAVAGPGADTRQWVSYGLVDPGEKSVIFTDENGDPSPIGPIVVVTLQPSGITVPCRVASTCAGNGEGEWVPFMPGDEVIVIIPEGNEQAGCCIVGRLNQSIDKFPLTVAGMDVTKNTFGFKRLRTPYVIETSSSFMIRSALTGAGLTIDATGNLFMVSGDGHKVILHGSFVKLEANGGDDFVQIDPGTHEILMQAGSGSPTQFSIGEDTSTFYTTGTLNIGTSGFSGQGHAITLEQLTVILECLLVAIGAVAAPPALIPIAATVVDVALAAASVFPLNPQHNPVILAGLQVPADPLGLKPGIGRAGLML